MYNKRGLEMSNCMYAANGTHACIAHNLDNAPETFSDYTTNTVLITKQDTPDSIFNDIYDDASTLALVTAYVKLIQFIRSREPQIGSAYRMIAKAGGYIHTCIYVLAYVLVHHDAGHGADAACARVMNAIRNNALSHAYQTWILGITGSTKCDADVPAMQCVVAAFKKLPISYEPAPYYATFRDLLSDYVQVARTISLSDQYRINGV